MIRAVSRKPRSLHLAAMLLAIASLAGAGIGGVWFWNRSPLLQSTAGPTDADEFELDPQKQGAIWLAEHVTFELEHRLGKAFRADWSRGDAAALATHFAPSVSAGIIDLSDAPERSQAGVSERFKTATPRSGDRHQLAGQLVRLLEPFQTVDRSSFRVLHIEPGAADGEWSFRLLLTAVGFTPQGGLCELRSHHDVVCRVGDEKALDREACIANWQMLDLNLSTGEKSLFEETTRRAGLDRLDLPDNWHLPTDRVLQYRMQAAAADLDGDGLLDLAVASVDRPPKILRGIRGGAFQDVTAELGISPTRPEGYRFLAAWVDYDNDGFPDLLLGDRLYHNLAGRRLVDVSHTSNLVIDAECMGCAVADYNCDGLLDLYFVYQKPPHQSSAGQSSWIEEESTGRANELWRNEGRGRFRNVTLEANAGGGLRHTFAASWFFYDDDRYPDLYLANDFGRNVVLRNSGRGTFSDVSADSGAAGFATSMGVATGDYDNDGRCDIYVANMYSKMGRRIIGQVSRLDYPEGVYDQILGSCAGNRLYHRRSAGAGFEELGEQLAVHDVGWAFGPALLDVDNDGWLDLYSTAGFLSFEPGKPDG